jgi:hypothetical protein
VVRRIMMEACRGREYQLNNPWAINNRVGRAVLRLNSGTVERNPLPSGCPRVASLLPSFCDAIVEFA